MMNPTLNMTENKTVVMYSRKGKVSESFSEILRERSKRSLTLARRSILSGNVQTERARSALDYYTSNWQIFVHPGLFSMACEAVGGRPEETVLMQTVISMLAAGFDVHDDVIDNSEVKHDKPTVLGKFGKEMAILLGDAFLIRAFVLLGQLAEPIEKEKFKEILDSLQNCLFELGDAHVLELELRENSSMSSILALQVVKMKAASAAADMRVGAIVGGGTKGEIETLTEYGRYVGMLSTLRDEFIDLYEVDELRQRVKNEYPPIPVLYACKDLKAKKTILSILSEERPTKRDLEKLRVIAFKAAETEGLTEQMRNLYKLAEKLSNKLKQSPVKSLLQSLLEALLEDVPMHGALDP